MDVPEAATQLVRIVEGFLNSRLLDIQLLFHPGPLRRRILIVLNTNLVVQHVMHHVALTEGCIQLGSRRTCSILISCSTAYSGRRLRALAHSRTHSQDLQHTRHERENETPSGHSRIRWPKLFRMRAINSVWIVKSNAISAILDSPARYLSCFLSGPRS